MLFNKKTTSSNQTIEVAYKLLKAESGSLFIYNQGKPRITKLNITLINENGDSFHYAKDVISTRSNEVIEFSKQIDLQGRLFEGSISKINIETNGNTYRFKPLQNGKFEKY